MNHQGGQSGERYTPPGIPPGGPGAIPAQEIMLEVALTCALETAPTVAIGPDFADRVAALARMDSAGSARWQKRGAHLGEKIAWVLCAVLLLGAVVLTTPVGGFAGRQWIEFGIALEFAALTAWLSLRTLLWR